MGTQMQARMRFGGLRVVDDIPGRNDGELHWSYLATRRHPRGRNHFVSHGANLFDCLVIHHVGGASNLDDGLIWVQYVVAVLEIEAKRMMGIVFDEDVTDGTVDDFVN